MSLTDIFSQSIGIDLGTANTLVYIKNEGIVVREPSVVAINTNNNKVSAVGIKAKDMFERTPNVIRAIRPLKDGVIADFDVTQIMLKYFISKALEGRKFFKPKIVICVPAGVTSIERRAVEDAAINAGAKKVKLVEEPMAAAIGAGLPVAEANGNMIVDIGGGTTEIAIISLGGIVASESLRIAGDDMDVEIKNYIRKRYKLEIGLTTSENIKKTLGNATEKYYDKLEISNKSNQENTVEDIVEAIENEDNEEIKEIKEVKDEQSNKLIKDMEIRGRDIVSGLPKSIIISCDEIRIALSETVNNIINSIKRTLEKAPPELASDLLKNGITLTGGGAMLKGLDSYIENETGLLVQIAQNPLECVAIGTGIICESM